MNMASSRLFLARFLNLVNSSGTSSLNTINVLRHFASIPSHYVEPLYKKKDQEAIRGTVEEIKLSRVLIKPARNNETCSEFYDDTIKKFTNYIMRKGKKELARSLMEQTFEHVKILQLERYNSLPPEKQQHVELDPKVILHKAIVNCTPVLQLLGMRKGGILYQVPVPLNDNRARFLAMNWLIRGAKEKQTCIYFSQKLARELIDASNNQGKVVKKKQELHKQCEANRAYAHFRWQ